MALAPLRKKRATDEVYDSLRAAILSRHFQPGERLLADELCDQLGVSLTPVRHALQQLSVEGLVEIHPRSGTYVASISEEDLIETFEIRLSLELLAGKRAIGLWNDDSNQTFKLLLKALAKPVNSTEDLRRHEELNHQFHFALFDMAGSRRLRELYESLNAHIQIARIHATEGPGLNARLKQEQVEHEAIVDSLTQSSLPRLEEALRSHILRAQNSLVAALQARDLQLSPNENAKNGKSKRM